MTSDVYSDIKTTATAIQQGDWMHAGLGAVDAAIDVIGAVGDPFAAIAGAGFSFLTEHVQFLREPLDMLLGDPGGITAMAKGWDGASQQLTTAAQQYQNSSSSQTSNWQGSAGDAYRSTSSDHADAITGLAEVGKSIGEAVSGAGQVLAEVRNTVLTEVNSATTQISTIMTQAMAEAPATYGASIALGISQSIQVAVTSGQKCMVEVGKFVASLQKLLPLLTKVLTAAKSIIELVDKIGGTASGEQSSNSTQSSSTDSGAQLPSNRKLTADEQKAAIQRATDILAAQGVPRDKMDPAAIATIIAHESGGDPNAVNNDDSNAAKGTPSKGLMQTIEPTFNSYKLPGHDNITDPVDNIIAGVRYSIDRYGSVSNVPGVRNVGNGEGYVGY